jgi:uncharacterized spore protein YtfJ
MNPDDILNDSITYGVPTGVVDTSAWAANTITAATNSGSSIKIKPTADQIMDEHSLNRIAVDHKVTAQELLKLQEVAPDYASEIKENIAKNLARDIAKKVMFKKKHDKDADVHHFIGRVWVFTDEELKELLQEVM